MEIDLIIYAAVNSFGFLCVILVTWMLLVLSKKTAVPLKYSIPPLVGILVQVLTYSLLWKADNYAIYIFGALAFSLSLQVTSHFLRKRFIEKRRKLQGELIK